MPKAKKKSKVKRSVTCGKCNEVGHNARTCPTKVKAAEVVVEAPPTPAKPEPKINLREEKPVSKRTREAPTADMGAKASASPFRCQKCNSVGILVIVKVKDHNESFKKKKGIFKGEMRCEDCMNKPNPAELILKWGAKPDEVVSFEAANA